MKVFIFILCILNVYSENKKSSLRKSLVVAKVQKTDGSKTEDKTSKQDNKSLYKAIYMRSKLMPKEHIHGPNCEHNQFRIE